MGRLLVFVAHKDDEALSCGGLIHSRVAEGHAVRVVTVFGRQYNYGEGDQYTEEQHAEFVQSIALLGVTDYSCHDLLEGEPHQHGYYSVLQVLESELAAFDPTEVVLPSRQDLNQDHRWLAECGAIALRPANLRNVRRILAAHGLDGGYPRGVNWFLPLSSTTLLCKLAAIACYRREARADPHPRGISGLDSWHRQAGTAVGVAFAEPYTLLLNKELL